MTVAELIEELKKHPQNSRVLVSHWNGHDHDYENPQVVVRNVIKNENPGWDSGGQFSKQSGAEAAVCLICGDRD